MGVLTRCGEEQGWPESDRRRPVMGLLAVAAFRRTAGDGERQNRVVSSRGPSWRCWIDPVDNGRHETEGGTPAAALVLYSATLMLCAVRRREDGGVGPRQRRREGDVARTASRRRRLRDGGVDPRRRQRREVPVREEEPSAEIVCGPRDRGSGTVQAAEIGRGSER